MRIAITGHKGFSDTIALFRSYRNILQVGVGRRQALRRRDRLVVRSMDAPGPLVDDQQQLVRVGTFELADATVIDNDGRQIIVIGQFGQNVLGRGWLSFRGLADHRQALLLEQDFLQLLGGTDIELAAGRCEGGGFRRGDVIVEQGEIRKDVEGETIHVAPSYDPDAIEDIRSWFSQYYTIQFENYPVDELSLQHLREVETG